LGFWRRTKRGWEEGGAGGMEVEVWKLGGGALEVQVDVGVWC